MREGKNLNTGEVANSFYHFEPSDMYEEELLDTQICYDPPAYGVKQYT